LTEETVQVTLPWNSGHRGMSFVVKGSNVILRLCSLFGTA